MLRRIAWFFFVVLILAPLAAAWIVLLGTMKGVIAGLDD